MISVKQSTTTCLTKSLTDLACIAYTIDVKFINFREPTVSQTKENKTRKRKIVMLMGLCK